jgi:hypothetical protein
LFLDLARLATLYEEICPLGTWSPVDDPRKEDSVESAIGTVLAHMVVAARNGAAGSALEFLAMLREDVDMEIHNAGVRRHSGASAVDFQAHEWMKSILGESEISS